jgi:SnoaL-like domain
LWIRLSRVQAPSITPLELVGLEFIGIVHPVSFGAALKDFRRAVEANDADAMVACLAEDVVFHSPVAFREYTGRPVVSVILRAVLTVFEDFRYASELHGDGQTALVFHARIGDKAIQGIDLGEMNAEGKLTRLTVLVRPLSAALALRDAMQTRLAGMTPPA